jgi:hypothetical protein
MATTIGIGALMASQQALGGHMYKVPAWSALGTKNRMRNLIPVQPKKGTKKLVSSNFAKILGYKSSD